MNIKYNRVSTFNQSGNRFHEDETKYDLVLLDKISGSINFRDRDKGKLIVQLVKDGKVKTLTVEELSRLGRNHIDVITTLDFLEQHEVNVIIRNLGVSSRVEGKSNPIWKVIVSVLTTMYSLELENIRERTTLGRLVYVKNGGRLGRHQNSLESDKKFIEKPKSQLIMNHLKKHKPIRDIAKIVGCSTATVLKVKRFIEK